MLAKDRPFQTRAGVYSGEVAEDVSGGRYGTKLLQEPDLVLDLAGLVLLQERLHPSQELATRKLINHQDAIMHFASPVVFCDKWDVMPLVVGKNGPLLLDGEGHLFPVFQATSGYFINVDGVKAPILAKRPPDQATRPRQ